MTSSRPALTLSFCLLWGCGGPSSADGLSRTLSVVAACSPTELTAALQHHERATLVVALDCDSATTQAAVTAAGREQQPFLIVVGERSGEAKLPDALIEASSGAEAAVDLALLACNGVPPTNTRYELGARTWTAANQAAGGGATVAPADAILAMLRQQRADLLTTQPTTDEVHRVVMFLPTEATKEQMIAVTAARAAAARYPQLELVEERRAAPSTPTRARAATILATSDPKHTQAAIAQATRADGSSAAVIVLDPLLDDAHASCRIGCHPRTLARAVAAQIRALMPEGGDILICAPDGQRPVTNARRDALATALGLEPATLR